MAFLRQWLLGVVSCAFLVSLLDQLTPEGSVRKLARFSGGLVLILCMLRPLGTAEPWELALDLDGTLTNDQKVVTPATRAALDAAAAKGVTIVLASGRPTAGVMPLAKELGLDKKGGCILSYNGGAIIDCATGETLYRKQLDAKYVPQLCAFAREQGVDKSAVRHSVKSGKAAMRKYLKKFL